jgi:hypothetical protein
VLFGGTHEMMMLMASSMSPHCGNTKHGDAHD